MTYTEFKTYFESLGTSHTDIQSTALCDAFETVQESLSGKATPALWLESPVVAWNDNNDTGLWRVFKTQLVICEPVQYDNKELKQTKLDELLELITEFIRKLNADYEDDTLGHLEFITDIEAVNIDNYIGWSIEIEIGGDIRMDINTLKWQ